MATGNFCMKGKVLSEKKFI